MYRVTRLDLYRDGGSLSIHGKSIGIINTEKEYVIQCSIGDKKDFKLYAGYPNKDKTNEVTSFIERAEVFKAVKTFIHEKMHQFAGALEKVTESENKYHVEEYNKKHRGMEK